MYSATSAWVKGQLVSIGTKSGGLGLNSEVVLIVNYKYTTTLLE